MKYSGTGLTLIAILLLVCMQPLAAQKPKKWTSVEIHDAIQKLNFLGSALYVAAHPDDENTRMISYLANDVKANVAYLSMTRGDGGQNLIGPEIRELLGLIRTQELLAARRVDGGNQLFTRANDFGFSKTPEETLKIWNKEAVLADVVWAIRTWQPDIIINRFQRTVAPRLRGRMHGHHTASAMLSYEAFDLAAREDAYPEQLQYLYPWQAKSLFFNTSWFFFGSREAFEKSDKTGMLAVDVGTYFSKRGISNTEISSLSRSMHKSQGFGSTGTRGRSMEYVSLLKGELPPDKEDLFSGINTTWTRVEEGAPIGELLKQVEKNFDFDTPSRSIPDLLKAYQMIEDLGPGYWRGVKLKEITEVIKACMGLFFEAVASDHSANPGQMIDLQLEFTNRSDIEARLINVLLTATGPEPAHSDQIFLIDTLLANNERVTIEKSFLLPDTTAYSAPYWLNESWELGMYTVNDQSKIGLPETTREVQAMAMIGIGDAMIQFPTNVVFKRNDPVAGEVYRPFEIIPPVSVRINEKVHLFANESPREVALTVQAGKDSISGKAGLQLPDGWRTEPEHFDFNLQFKGQEEQFSFKLFPPETQSEGEIRAQIEMNGQTFNREMILIEYDHIPTQTVLLESKAKVVKVDLQKAGDKIGYIMGAGDLIPENLEQIGYDVTRLNAEDITIGQLRKFDAVIVGIRAYNTVDRLKFQQPQLMQYVEEGGTMIVQYNTNRRLKVPADQIGPYPLTISRDRVTEEDAEVRILQPDHPVLNFPNKITQKDFDGWVQERGLYFPNEWDERYQPILSSNDVEEDPKNGGLLVAKYGEGHYVYTGYSWFRELPAGVPGAYRLFVNLISLGNEVKP